MQQYMAEYLRLSTEDGDIAIDDAKQESDSISHQRDLLKEYKAQHGMSEQKSLEFVDDGFSGTNFNRPGVTKLLEMVRRGKISCILVKDISRFGRNYLEVGDYLEQVFPFMGVRFISVNDHYDSSDYVGTTGGIEVAFKSMLYDMYSKDLSIKMRSALEIRRKHGDCTSPVPPFGYALSYEGKRKLVIDPLASKYVLKIFELANLGYTTGRIARKLNEDSIPTPAMYKNMTSSKRNYSISDNVGYWNAKMVLNILENKVYLGISVGQKHRVLKVGGKQYVKVPDEERICVPNMHEPIVTEELFYNANKVIKKRSGGGTTSKRKRGNSESVLRGKLFCGECGRRLIRIKCTTIPYFRCEKKDYDKNCRCPKLHLGEPEIEAVVKKCIVKEVEKIDNWNEKFGAEKLFDNINKQIRNLEADADTLKLHKQYLYEKFKLGYLNQEQYLNKTKSIRVKETKNQELLEGCKKSKAEVKEKVAVLKNTKDFNYITKDIVDALVERINVYDENRIEIIWRFKFFGK